MDCDRKKYTAAVLATVDAPYGSGVTADELAARIVDPASALSYDPHVFAFFSEVPEGMQRGFLNEMSIDFLAASEVARLFEDLCGYSLALSNRGGKAQRPL